jgi:DNA-binding CsgD family transcriptional regulator
VIPLVGRQPELELLRGELGRVRQGELRVVLLAGEAGVGKSRLMMEAVSDVDDVAVVLTARSYLLGATASFGPWIEALDRHVRPRGSGLASHGSTIGHADPEDRAAIMERMADILERLSHDGPVYVALDDMDLADASSWEALRFLSRRLFDRPIAVALTVRPARLAAIPLALDVLLSLEDDGMLRRVNVRPFNHVELAELTADRLRAVGRAPSHAVPRALVDWLMERSLGHPLFAIGLLEALIDEGGNLGDPEVAGPPERLVERVRRETYRLRDREREVLEVLAVMDRRVRPHDIASVLGWVLEEVAQPLESLCTSSLVVESTVGSDVSYEIAHPLVQDSIYRTIVGARRLAIHRAVARLLLARGSWGAAAGHFARSAELPDEESLAALCDAIRRAGSGGLYREALAILGALMEVLPRGDHRWRRVFEALAPHAGWVTDHLAEQDAEVVVLAMRRVEEVYAAEGSPLERGLVQVYLAASLAIGAGRLDEAERAGRRALELFERAGDRDRALLARNELVWIASCAGDLDRATDVGAAVMEEVDEHTDPIIEIQTAGALAYALSLRARFQEANALYEQAGERARATGNRYRLAWGHVQRSLLHLLAGHLDRAVSSVEAPFAIDHALACDALGPERLAQCRWLEGRIEDCVRLVEESGARRSVRGSRRRAWGLALAARAHAEAGRRRRARLHLGRARDTYGGAEILDWSAWCDWTAGFLAHCDGSFEEAFASYGKAAERYRSMGARAPEVLVRVDAVEAALDSGDAERAGEVAGRLQELTETVAGKLAVASARLARAVECLTRGTPDAGAAEGAMAAFEQGGFRLLATSAAYVTGLSRQRSGDREALAPLEWAARSCEKLGAVWRRDRILRAIGEHGTKGKRVLGSVLGPSSLTAREREVAELAARGRTAKEIAEELFIGTRTVETHLARIYPKLGVGSKRELARRGRELGIVPPHPQSIPQSSP